MARGGILQSRAIDGLKGWLKSPVDHQPLFFVASWGEGWDHLSVSRRKRTPTWGELEFMRKLFFKEDETAMQLHVPETDHVNVVSTCLHLWRPQHVEIPRPPKEFV